MNGLIEFEKSVALAFERAEIPSPVHLSGGNEAQLIEIFNDIEPDDWVFSTYRSHYHALLHGIPSAWLMQRIRIGISMNLSSPGYRFFTSAIVGGAIPIAVGVACALKRQNLNTKVWCFLGDMAATTGIFYEATQYAKGHDLPIHFVIEDNGLSADSPTLNCWGAGSTVSIKRYAYTLTWPHVNTGKWVNF